MKKFILQAMLVLGFGLSYGFSYAQTPASSCSKKGTANCPLVKDCPKKGTQDCPYAVSTVSRVVKNVKADCSLVNTADCPIEKCPQKGTKDCPVLKASPKVSYAVNKTVDAKSEKICRYVVEKQLINMKALQQLPLFCAQR